MIQTRACLVRWYFMIVIRFFSKMAMPASFPSTNYRPNPRLVYLHAFGRCTSARGNPAFSNGLTTRDGGHLNVWKCVKTTVVHWIVWDLKKSNEHRQLSKIFFHRFSPILTKFQTVNTMTCTFLVWNLWRVLNCDLIKTCNRDYPDRWPNVSCSPPPIPGAIIQIIYGATCSQTLKWKTCPMGYFGSWWADAWMYDLEDIDPRNATGRKTTINHQYHQIYLWFLSTNKGPRCNEHAPVPYRKRQRI